LWLNRLAWLYLALVLAFWLFLRQGDDWWPATVALYVPRWPFALPLVVLVPAAVRWPWRVALPVGFAAVVFAWPILDAVVNLPRGAAPAGGTELRVMSFNADGGHFSRAAFQSVLDVERPDVIAVQESCPELGEADFWGSGWRVQAAPSGVLIASRFTLEPVDAMNLIELGGRGGAVRIRIDSPLGKVMLVDVHLDTPRWGLEAIRSRHIDEMRANIALRDAGSARVRQWLNDAPAATVIAGDFNLTTQSAIYRRYWAGCQDSFEEAGLGWGYTKHTSWHGVRIDHVLHGPVLSCSECRVCPDVGSDHRPVVAVLQRASTPRE
jgi:endonuclease/exonuclease/phosphatase (EEP) superfamily protein YafD